jgi:type IV pilus assembly protein PilW
MSRRPSGVTLIELMVALVLGLIVSGAAITLLLSNRQTYLATESLGRLQDNSATAFEMMARDVREAGGNPCDSSIDITNVVSTPTAHWYTDFGGGIRGYGGTDAFADAAFGTGKQARVSGTDALEIRSSVADGVTIVKHKPNSAEFEVNTKNHGLHQGDIAMACDFNHAAIFQVTGANPGTNTTIVHNLGASVSPGNCTKGLGAPLNCDAANGTSYEFGCKFGGQDASIDCKLAANRWTAVIAKLRATRWYVGNNGRGTRSLFETIVRNQGGVLKTDNEEIAENIEDMSLSYLVPGSATYQPASSIADWSSVVAVRIDLTMTGLRNLGTDGNPLQRTLSHVVAIRSRAQ